MDLVKIWRIWSQLLPNSLNYWYSWVYQSNLNCTEAKKRLFWVLQVTDLFNYIALAASLFWTPVCMVCEFQRWGTYSQIWRILCVCHGAWFLHWCLNIWCILLIRSLQYIFHKERKIMENSSMCSQATCNPHIKHIIWWVIYLSFFFSPNSFPVPLIHKYVMYMQLWKAILWWLYTSWTL